METERMIQHLLDRFGDHAIEQSVWLDTGRTCDIREMSSLEVERLYCRFFPKPKSTTEVMVELLEEQELKRLRFIILTDAQFMGIYKTGNWKRFNAFMLNSSVLKKQLNQYTIEEFPFLIRQFKSMRTKFNKKSIQPFTNEWYAFFELPKPSKN